MRRYSDREPSLPRQLYARKTARQLSDLEEEATHAFDAHVVVSERDGERLRELWSATAVSVIENGVDSAHYSDSEIEAAHAAWSGQNSGEVDPSPVQAKRIVFVGSMDYHANIDGVVTFAREVWPALHERHPEMIFTIVGRDPSAEVLQLASMPGVEVTGTVDDVRPYYREAILSIVPLKVGGGSRLKILEAMAAGVPVVSTTLGAEGLDVRNSVDIFIADTNEQQSEAITAVIENEGLRRQRRVEGRALVARRYDWTRVGDSLFKLYEELLAARGAA
jgi:glycosyltransferase involved in cell wall biosynthesis